MTTYNITKTSEPITKRGCDLKAGDIIVTNNPPYKYVMIVGVPNCIYIRDQDGPDDYYTTVLRLKDRSLDGWVIKDNRRYSVVRNVNIELEI